MLTKLKCKICESEITFLKNRKCLNVFIRPSMKIPIEEKEGPFCPNCGEFSEYHVAYEFDDE